MSAASMKAEQVEQLSEQQSQAQQVRLTRCRPCVAVHAQPPLSLGLTRVRCPGGAWSPQRLEELEAERASLQEQLREAHEAREALEAELERAHEVRGDGRAGCHSPLPGDSRICANVRLSLPGNRERVERVQAAARPDASLGAGGV